jgi:hypothetical protein
MMRVFLLVVIVTMATVVNPWVVPVSAELVIEPVINIVPGSGQAENNFPLYQPDFLVDGVAYWTANEPGEIVTYAAGDPRDEFLDVFHVWNNTAYNIDGLNLQIIGTGTDTQNPGTVVRGPTDAVWGDVDGDEQIGQSDIFSTIIVSADQKSIRLEGGIIPVGGRFTDIHLAMSENPPELAGIDSWFTGVVAVPEPAAGLLACMFAAVMSIVWWRRA